MDSTELTALLYNSNERLAQTSEGVYQVGDLQTRGEIEVLVSDFDEVRLPDFTQLANGMANELADESGLWVILDEPDEPLSAF